MATYTTVQNVYSTVCDVLLEPFVGGIAPGLSLGIITQAQFLQIFGTVLIDFLNRTSLTWEIATQQLMFGTTQYLYPTQISTIEQVFIDGVDIEHSTLQDLDSWNYRWRNARGVPEFYHQDGLAPKLMEVAVAPNYTGAGYAIIPGNPPAYNIFGRLNQAPIGTSQGVATISGTTVTWSSGDIFNIDWNGYYPPPNIVLNGTPYPIDSVTSSTVLVLAVDPSLFVATWSVSIGPDGNLSILGAQSISSVAFALGDVIPSIPDSFTPYLSYGVLAKIFSMDGECRDIQRAAYCSARFQEGVNAAASVAGNLV